MVFKGAITALITPFIDGKIDEAGFIRNIHHQIDAGISGLVVLGSTGESATLSREERECLIAIAVKEAKGKIPIIVGTGSNCTRITLELSKKAEELGADALIVVTPYYNRPTQEGIFRHFEQLVANTSLPIIAYNVQTRTGVNIETPTLVRIAQLPRIVGVKESSGNLTQVGEVIEQIKRKDERFSVTSGDDVYTLPLVALGGDGVISVISNLLPEKVVELANSALNGDFETAREIHYELLPLVRGAFLEVNPVPIKEAMNFMGLPAGGYRLPLCEMSLDNRAKLHKILLQMELSGCRK